MSYCRTVDGTREAKLPLCASGSWEDPLHDKVSRLSSRSTSCPDTTFLRLSTIKER